MHLWYFIGIFYRFSYIYIYIIHCVVMTNEGEGERERERIHNNKKRIVIWLKSNQLTTTTKKTVQRSGDGST